MKTESTLYHCFKNVWFALMPPFGLILAIFCFSGTLGLSKDVLQKIDAPEAGVLCIKTKEGELIAMVDMGHGDCLAKADVNEPLFCVGGLEGALVGCIPHAKQRLKCSHENKITFCLDERAQTFQQLSLTDTIQISSNHTSPNSKFVAVGGITSAEKWQVIALKGGFVGERIVDLLHSRSTVCFIRDENYDEYVVLIDKEGSVAIHSVESLLKHPAICVAESEQCVEIPISLEMGGGAFYIKLWPAAEQFPLSVAVEKRVPCAHLCFSDAGRSEILSLTCDPEASAPFWPLFGGKYLVRYQMIKTAPH